MTKPPFWSQLSDAELELWWMELTAGTSVQVIARARSRGVRDEFARNQLAILDALMPHEFFSRSEVIARDDGSWVAGRPSALWNGAITVFAMAYGINVSIHVPMPHLRKQGPIPPLVRHFRSDQFRAWVSERAGGELALRARIHRMFLAAFGARIRDNIRALTRYAFSTEASEYMAKFNHLPPKLHSRAMGPAVYKFGEVEKARVVKCLARPPRWPEL